MDFKTYLKESARTVSDVPDFDDEKTRMLLGAIGLCTESGEIMDVFKKALYHGRELDTVNLKEELGDLLWYLAILMRELNLDLDEVLEINIRKLRLRYGKKFDASKSLSRDTQRERKVLEN